MRSVWQQHGSVELHELCQLDHGDDDHAGEDHADDAGAGRRARHRSGHYGARAGGVTG